LEILGKKKKKFFLNRKNNGKKKVNFYKKKKKFFFRALPPPPSHTPHTLRATAGRPSSIVPSAHVLTTTEYPLMCSLDEQLNLSQFDAVGLQTCL